MWLKAPWRWRCSPSCSLCCPRGWVFQKFQLYQAQSSSDWRPQGGRGIWGSWFWGLTPQVSSHGQAEPAAAEVCSPPAHTDLCLVVPHTRVVPAGLPPAQHREDLTRAVMFFLTDIWKHLQFHTNNQLSPKPGQVFGLRPPKPQGSRALIPTQPWLVGIQPIHHSRPSLETQCRKYSENLWRFL